MSSKVYSEKEDVLSPYEFRRKHTVRRLLNSILVYFTYLRDDVQIYMSLEHLIPGLHGSIQPQSEAQLRLKEWRGHSTAPTTQLHRRS